MAEPVSKRYREETQIEENEKEGGKRCKSFNHILSVLDHEEEEEEEETTEDLSSIITTLKQEIDIQETRQPTSSSSFTSSATILMEYQEDSAEDEERERVMRLLLEASDDELGIPNSEFVVSEEIEDGFGLNDAFLEMEDEIANYNLLFQ